MNLMKMIQATCFLLMVSLSASLLAETIWIDVRTALEHKVDHIDGDIRISHGDIVPEVSKLYPDKNTEIHLYCRSGGRAGKAMAELKVLGYTNISNAGSINDARKERKIIE